MEQALRFESHAFGRPYHAARVRIPARTRDTELHTHADFHEFMGVLSGRGEHLLTRGVDDLVAGNVVLVRPHDRTRSAARRRTDSSSSTSPSPARPGEASST
ncbi:hypothetical protein [Kribbella sp. NBC_00359]|uniref:hypothetical protein n=1 Tax=Kribbella sp. NBC_00359 TaxID=2975966 RepID=UPI002E1A391B